jgi:hypothetical protein
MIAREQYLHWGKMWLPNVMAEMFQERKNSSKSKRKARKKWNKWEESVYQMTFSSKWSVDNGYKRFLFFGICIRISCLYNNKWCNQKHTIMISYLWWGLSGLTAALTILDARPTTGLCVLEWKKRLGGRVWSQKMKKNLYAELGAEWIGKNDTYLLGFV